jgi:hypothetical protein
VLMSHALLRSSRSERDWTQRSLLATLCALATPRVQQHQDCSYSS